jgi:hypothetical protein
MDPNIGKATIGKERTVAECKESLPTSRTFFWNYFYKNTRPKFFIIFFLIFFFKTFEEASSVGLTKEHDFASDAFARAARVRRLPHRTVDAGAACSGAQHT